MSTEKFSTKIIPFTQNLHLEFNRTDFLFSKQWKINYFTKQKSGLS